VKTILLLAHADNGQTTRLDAALALVRAFDGHLLCVDVAVIPESVADYAGRGTGLLLVDELRDEARHAARLRERLATEAVSFEVVATTGFLPQTLQDHAALADLIVVSTALKDGFPDMERIIADLLQSVQRPILAVPEQCGAFAPRGHALVAWDGSPDAEAALRAAVPLLTLASKVTLVHVQDGSLVLPVEDAARYLSRHGIEPVIHPEPTHRQPAAMVLEDVIDQTRPAFVVLGGFSRGRTRETLFGGVSHRLLTRSPRPLFMMHRGR
jgi:nucleotide-binding universal stress UspA family protein